MEKSERIFYVYSWRSLRKREKWHIVDLLVQIEDFIQIHHKDMSREEFEAFKRVTEYIADIEVKE